MAPSPALVVGLGNPGPEYADNRHNVGVRVVELLAARAGSAAGSRSTRANADVLEARLAGRRVVLAKPRTYMNVSGGPVAGLLRFFSVRAGGPIVVHDDLDLAFGVVRLKQRRRRGRPQRPAVDQRVDRHQGLPARPVRHRPTAGPAGPGRLRAQAVLRRRAQGADFAVDLAADAAEALLRDGLEAAQNRLHALSG